MISGDRATFLDRFSDNVSSSRMRKIKSSSAVATRAYIAGLASWIGGQYAASPGLSGCLLTTTSLSPLVDLIIGSTWH